MEPEFLSYQSVVVKCFKDFERLCWTQYDRAFRQQVTVTKDLCWSQINGTLYSLYFAGKAKKSTICATASLITTLPSAAPKPHLRTAIVERESTGEIEIRRQSTICSTPWAAPDAYQALSLPASMHAGRTILSQRTPPAPMAKPSALAPAAIS